MTPKETAIRRLQAIQGIDPTPIVHRPISMSKTSSKPYVTLPLAKSHIIKMTSEGSKDGVMVEECPYCGKSHLFPIRAPILYLGRGWYRLEAECGKGRFDTNPYEDQ